VCGSAVLDAVAPAAASPLYFPDSGPAHQVEQVYLSGTLQPDTAVDIGAVLDRKTAALACHRSQLGEGQEWVRELVAQRAADAGRGQGLRYAEVFRVLRLA
jgi:LmbE family N-acetylglucosaminyl deacetylase